MNFQEHNMLFGKYRALASKVLATSHAVECYRHSCIINEKININIFRKDVGHKEMEIAVYTKFSQNEHS